MPRKNRLGNAAKSRRGAGSPKSQKASKIGVAGTKVARTPVTRRARPMSSR